MLEEDTSLPTYLTRGGIKELYDMPSKSKVKGRFYIFQVTSSQVFPTDPKVPRKENSVKVKLTLSDGVASCRSFVSDQVFTKLEVIPQVYNIIKLTQMTKTDISGQMAMVLRDPIEIVYDHVNAKIGAPEDINKVMASPDIQSFNFYEDIQIPMPGMSQPQHQMPQGTKQRANIKPIQHTNDNQDQGNQLEKAHPSSLPKNITRHYEDNEKNFQQQKRTQVQKQALNHYMPIKALNTFTRDWKIMARVTQKSERRTTKSGGSLLKVNLMDTYGTKIEATFFDDAVDQFERILIEGKTYTFANGNVKIANKKFTTIKNDFCLTFEKSSSIKEVEDDGSIAGSDSAYDFTLIKQLEQLGGGQGTSQRQIDILGLIIDLSEAEVVKLRNQNEKVRKYVTLVDETCCSVVVTIWGEMCDKYLLNLGDIVAITGARVSDYGGKSLNAAMDHADVVINPNHDRARKLSMWYNDFISKYGPEAVNKIKPLTNKMGGGSLPEGRGMQGSSGGGMMGGGKNLDSGRGSGANTKNQITLLCEVADQLSEANDVDASHIYFINGFLCQIKNDYDKLVYLACPNDNCKRKIQQEHSGHYRCEACDKSYEHGVPTYMVIAKIADFTDSVYVNFAREHGTALMGGLTAQQFSDLRYNSDEYSMNQTIESLMFKPFNIMIKGKFEYYQGENRMRYFAVKLVDYNFKMENKALLRRLETYKHIQPSQQNPFSNQNQYGGGGFPPPQQQQRFGPNRGGHQQYQQRNQEFLQY